MVPGVPCVDRGNWGRERDIARLWPGRKHDSFLRPACDRIRCFAKKVSAGIAPYTFVSHKKMSIFFRKGRCSNYSLKSQPGVLMLETFSWDNNRDDPRTDKNTDLPTPITCKFGGFEKNPRKGLGIRTSNLETSKICDPLVVGRIAGAPRHPRLSDPPVHLEIKRQSHVWHPKSQVSRSNRESWKVWFKWAVNDCMWLLLLVFRTLQKNKSFCNKTKTK